MLKANVMPIMSIDGIGDVILERIDVEARPAPLRMQNATSYWLKF